MPILFSRGYVSWLEFWNDILVSNQAIPIIIARSCQWLPTEIVLARSTFVTSWFRWWSLNNSKHDLQTRSYKFNQIKGSAMATLWSHIYAWLFYSNNWVHYSNMCSVHFASSYLTSWSTTSWGFDSYFYTDLQFRDVLKIKSMSKGSLQKKNWIFYDIVTKLWQLCHKCLRHN